MSAGTSTTHMVGHVPTMMLVTSEPVQEARHSQVGHTPTTGFSGFCKPVWATRHSSTSLNWEAMKRRSWGGKASTETLATIEVVQEARCSMVGHTATPTRSGSIESVREARLTFVGRDPTSKSDGKSTKNSATLRGATPVSVASGTTTPGREFPGSAASGTTTPGRKFLGSAMSDKSSPGREFPGSMTSDTTTPGREFLGSVTSGTTTPGTLTPTSEVIPKHVVSPQTARSDLFDADNNVGTPHRFRRLGGASRQGCKTIAALRDQKGRARVRATQTTRRRTSQRRHLVAFGSRNHARRSGSWKQVPSTRLRRRLLGPTLSPRHACSGSSSKYFVRKYWACRQHAAPAATVKKERSYFSCRSLVAKQMLDVSSDVS
ncbi:hypothetical protein ACQJBY_018427 [Aegilops geniculata]